MRPAEAQGPPPSLLLRYLAFRRDELDDAPDDILRLAARAEYDGNPPDDVRAWLEERGPEV
jgi:hypothetical protein